MARRSGSLGPLLQGVSQQPDRVRLEGQVTAQVNLVSDVTSGLGTRPATVEGATLPNASGHRFQEIRLNSEDYILGYKSGDLRMWGFDGTEYPLTYRNGATTAYIGDDMRFHVVDKKAVLVNRDKVVATDSTVDGRNFFAGIFHAIGGQFLKTYTVTVDFSDGTSMTASYQTPDGTAAGDAAKTASEFIVNELVTALNALGTLPAGGFINRQFDVAQVRHPTLSIKIKTSDGEGGEILRSMSDTVKDVVDLPRFAANGHITKVVTSDAEEDDYWLKFQAKGETVEDGAAGFGVEGTWIEWYNPEEETNFDLTTMPHVIVEDGGAFYVEQGEWVGRQVGDSDSAPFVSIIGKRIRDIAGFESRLALLSPDTVVMTRTNKPFDLWRASATVVAATDPVDITSTKKDDLTLDWFVPLDRDLFVMADPGDSQFVIRGGGVNPNTLGMVLTTEFEIESGGTPPVPTGRTILFPFKAGAFSGIKEFYTDSENVSNVANTLTETQDEYITGALTHMAVSQNFNLGLFKTDQDETTVWVYKYLWDSREILQSAWSRWQFVDEVRYFFFRNAQVYFIGEDVDGDVFLHVLNLNRPVGEFGYHETMDRQIESTVTGGEITLPYPNARFLQSTGCADPGLEALPVSSVRVNALTHTYTLDPEVAPDGAVLRCGQSVDWLLTPTQVFGRDYQNRIDTSLEVTIDDYVVHVSQSGEFSALGESVYEDDYVYENFVFPFDGEPLDPNRLLLQSGPVTVPWGERADLATFTIKGNDIRPMTIHEIEWFGQVLRTKGSRA